MSPAPDPHDEFFRHWLRCEADLRAFVASLVRQADARDDVMQEIASTLWSTFDRYDRGRSFGAWARGIAARKIFEQTRQNARFPVAFTPEAIAAIADAFDRTESGVSIRHEALRHCLGQLPDRLRELLVLRYDQEQSVAEIAEQSQRSLDAVYQSLSRIRAKLETCIRRRLAREDGDPA